MSVWWKLVLVAGAVGLAACSDDEDAPPPSGVTGGTGGTTADAAGDEATGGTGGDTAGTGGADAGEAGVEEDAGVGGQEAGAGGTGGGTTIAIAGNIFDLVTQDPLGTVDLCVLGGPSSCIVTAGSSEYSIDVPANTEIALEATKEGYWRGLFPLATTDQDMDYYLFLASETAAGLVSSLLSVDIDESKGIVAVFVDAAGATPTLSPASGDGPFFISATGIPDSSAISTVSNGGVLFLNVDPGTVELRLEHPSLTCVSSSPWKGSTTDAAKAPVEAKTITAIASVSCE